MIQIEEMPISALIPYAGNARKHDEQNVSDIASSIAEYGFNDPIAINEVDSVLIEGHGRLLAARKLGLETVPVIKLGHMSAAQIKGYTLIHNRLAEKSEWDTEMLQVELSKLSEMDIDLDDIGFADNDLDDLGVDLDVSDGETYDEDKDDDIPEVEDNPYGVKRGDIWLLGTYLQCDSCDKKFEYDKTKVDQACEACDA